MEYPEYCGHMMAIPHAMLTISSNLVDKTNFVGNLPEG
jgi:hypothetical protein